jgi:SSS family solute:Na+ symporter
MCGMLAAALHHGLTVPTGATTLLKGGWLGDIHLYGSEMALNFWTAIYAWTTCFVVTIVVSLVTPEKKSAEDLCGLVYSLTPKIPEEGASRWFCRPAVLGVAMLVVCLVLNIIFR